MATRRSGIENQIQTLFDGGTVTGLTDQQLLEQFAAGRRRWSGNGLRDFGCKAWTHGPERLPGPPAEPA